MQGYCVPGTCHFGDQGSWKVRSGTHHFTKSNHPTSVPFVQYATSFNLCRSILQVDAVQHSEFRRIPCPEYKSLTCILKETTTHGLYKKWIRKQRSSLLIWLFSFNFCEPIICISCVCKVPARIFCRIQSQLSWIS